MMNSHEEAPAQSEYSWLDWIDNNPSFLNSIIVSGLQYYHQGATSSTPPPPPPPPPPRRLAPPRNQYHASPTPAPPPPPPPPPAPRISPTSNQNLVGDSLVLEILGAYQKLEERRKIADLVEQRKSIEKQLDRIDKEIETRTRRLNEMESPHSASKTYRRLDFAPPPPPPPPPRPVPQRLWHYNPSPPPSVAPQHLWQHTIPTPPPPPPPPSRGLKRGPSGVLKNILSRPTHD